MLKKNISKALTSGTLKQRLVLYFEDKARTVYNIETILSSAEAVAVSNSFKKPNEIKLFNKWLNFSMTVAYAITNLQGALFEVKMNCSDLRGYILSWNAIEHSELLANSILHEIKDPQKRIEIAKKGSNEIDLLFSKTTIDKEGYLDLKIEYKKGARKKSKNKEEIEVIDEMCLSSLIAKVKKATETSIIKYISWEKAILDYMEEEGFNIETYKNIINNLSNSIQRPLIGWEKYLSDTKSFLGFKRSKQLDRLKSKYAVTPVIEELEVDIDIYNYFKTEFLNNEGE